jgi:hypothetical protein
MTFTVQIGSGHALFKLPGNRFSNITREPLRIAEESARSSSQSQIKEARKL